ncbi:unnamed protein product [Adineta steineri]|uniref:AMOP domain-containing protein n=1 Tax=Adineta steineri TaxID=433720 RepID=A0A814X0E9_9BILA|nr:unnamed protein product [Adineta steineri]
MNVLSRSLESETEESDASDRVLKPLCQVPSIFPRQLNEGWVVGEGWVVDEACDPLKQPKTCDYHKGAYGCYRFAYSNTGSGAQACYDKNGNFISDPWKGGGTVDQETLSGDLIQSARHVACDVVSYYSCCQTFFSLQPYTCNLYYEKRPTGQCENKTAI